MKTLFDKPLYRKTDPETSRMAAEGMVVAGEWQRQKDMVYENLKRFNGSTSAELASFMNTDRYITARRLPDLQREGKAVKGHIRLCNITGRACVTWWFK